MKTNRTWNLVSLLTTYDVSFADFCITYENYFCEVDLYIHTKS